MHIFKASISDEGIIVSRHIFLSGADVKMEGLCLLKDSLNFLIRSSPQRLSY